MIWENVYKEYQVTKAIFETVCAYDRKLMICIKRPEETS